MFTHNPQQIYFRPRVNSACLLVYNFATEPKRVLCLYRNCFLDCEVQRTALRFNYNNTNASSLLTVDDMHRGAPHSIRKCLGPWTETNLIIIKVTRPEFGSICALCKKYRTNLATNRINHDIRDFNIANRESDNFAAQLRLLPCRSDLLLLRGHVRKLDMLCKFLLSLKSSFSFLIAIHLF